MKALDNAYNWTLEKAKGKNALPWLAVISFAEGIFSPIPPDPMLAVILSVQKKRAVFFSLICALSSVAGGTIGYLIGYLLFDTLGKSIMDFYGYSTFVDTVNPNIHTIAFWVILIKAFTPIPYKIIAIICGFLKIDLFIFISASFISRFMRFLIIASVFRKYGEHILNILEKNKLLFVILTVLAVIVGFVMLSYIR